MKVFIMPRRAGKTTALIRWVKEGERVNKFPYWNRIILCASSLEAARLRDNKEFDLNPAQVYSAFEWREICSRKIGELNRENFYPVKICVDNADLVLEMFLKHGSLEAISINRE